MVRFVNTPGFSNTNMLDITVLHLITDYFATAYKNNIKLLGIIYFYPILDTQITYYATKNLQMFQKLTEKNNLKNVNVLLVLGAKAISKSNKALRNIAAGQQHKQELANIKATIQNTATKNKLVVKALTEHYQKRLKNLKKTLKNKQQLNKKEKKHFNKHINTLENRGFCAVM
ncbi:hypothetical protein F4824DRAFT_486428 [Ustulina deusta]|nr:hypothetical protein F4824DRAFT_486428 [Ustulina deusta]